MSHEVIAETWISVSDPLSTSPELTFVAPVTRLHSFPLSCLSVMYVLKREAKMYLRVTESPDAS